jgi:hypothetical protein
LPRIRPFTEFELDPIDDEPDYAGRRRAGGAGEPNGPAGADPGDQSGGRRHRRAEDGDHDLLARLLAREGMHS